MDIWQATFVVLLVVTLLHSSVSFVWFALRRDKHPMKGHSLVLVSLGVIPLTLMCISICLVYIGVTVYCWVDLLAALNGLTVAVLVYIVRAWRIFVFYGLQTKKVINSPYFDASQTDLSIKSGDSFGASPRRRSILRVFRAERRFTMIAVALGVAAVLSEWIPFLEQGDYDGVYSPDLAVTCTESGTSLLVMLALVGCAAACLPFTAWRLRDKFDGFLIKRELKYCGACALLALVVTILEEGVPGINIRPIQATKIVVANAVIFSTVTWKVLASYGLCGGVRVKEQVSRSNQTSTRLSTVESVNLQTASDTKKFRLQDVLGSPVGLRLFTEHLKREWSVENLLFYQAVQVYRKACANESGATNEDRLTMAREIVDSFILVDAPNWVNLDSETSKDITARIADCVAPEFFDFHKDVVAMENVVDASPPADLFDMASDAIFRLMKVDSFVRFQSSPLFNVFIAER